MSKERDEQAEAQFWVAEARGGAADFGEAQGLTVSRARRGTVSDALQTRDRANT